MCFSWIALKIRIGLLVIFVCGLASTCDYRLVNQRPLPSDQELESIFEEHKQDFDRLKRMSEEDVDFVRVAYNFVWRSDDFSLNPDKGLPNARWDEYRQLFDKLRLNGGIARPVDQKMLMLISASRGMVTGGSSKGYAYSEIPPGPLYESLDSITPNEIGSNPAFKRIRGNWYLYVKFDS